jgi:hypothetical protein
MAAQAQSSQPERVRPSTAPSPNTPVTATASTAATAPTAVTPAAQQT